jgi:hypothetical protein
MSDQNETSDSQKGVEVSPSDSLNFLALVSDGKKPAVRFPDIAPHPGSYYHKVYSPSGDWNGIEAIVTLGAPHIDSARIRRGVPQDSFSTYLGGHGRQEIDAGLSWEVTRDKHGKVDGDHRAWRPFWRNGSWHSASAMEKFYWHPGDTVSMKLHAVAPDKLELTISDLGENPRRTFSKVFAAKGFGATSDAFFKRVDAIDQYGTEGKHVRKSHSHIDGIRWLETYLTAKNGERIALTPAFSRSINDPRDHVRIQSTHFQRLHGGEEVAIDATEPKKRI